ncbi:MAG TPA: hypothetical protein VGM13_08675 [Thermoanaerobaculia bacterium]|jgi:hypothetical protein
MTHARPITELLAECHDYPDLFATAVLRTKPRAWQHRALEEIGRRVRGGDVRIDAHLRCCHSAGKTWIAAVVTLWWTSTRPEARGLTTAPKWQTVEEVLWPEIRRLYAGSLLADLAVGRCLTTKLEFAEAWFTAGAASDRPETLEGSHSPTAALRVVDESKAVDDGVITSTEGLLASPAALDLWISTPSIRSGAFYERDVNGGPRVLRIVVTADDLIAEGVPGIAEWKAECLRKWGENSPEYRSRVMAEYIEEGEGALYPFAHIERAVAHSWRVALPVTAGYDVAGSVDGDENVVVIANGPDALDRREVFIAGAWKEHDTQISKGRALAYFREHGATSAKVDAIGIGKGVRDAIAQDFAACEEYRATSRPNDPTRFANRKAEDAWHVRELLEDGLLRLPPDPILRQQFLAMRYVINPQGRIRVVDPNDSPDRHDAVLIALSGRTGSGAAWLGLMEERARPVRAARPAPGVAGEAGPFYDAAGNEVTREGHLIPPRGRAVRSGAGDVSLLGDLYANGGRPGDAPTMNTEQLAQLWSGAARRS